MRSIAVTILLALLTTTSIAHAQESTRTEFNELCRIWQGRWIGDVILVADWPGIGKRGEKVTTYWDNVVTEDGNAMQGHVMAAPDRDQS